ncbi:MAG: hypothetical protein ACI8Y4_003019 [Candidatus Poriferisodalaceae bacterium]|jgi:hypothetical protein
MRPIARPLPEAGPQVLVLACGALAREIIAITRLNGLAEITLECLPANLHNRPTEIPAAVEARLSSAVVEYDRVLVGYGDCGTGGLLDDVCRRYGVTRLPGAHCYEFFAGQSGFAEIHDDDPANFYLTDYLAKHFDRIIIEGLGIDEHPELLDMYFGNYRRVILLAQTDDASLINAGRAAATRLGLEFEVLSTGYGELSSSIVEFVSLTRRGIDPRSTAESTEIEIVRGALA